MSAGDQYMIEIGVGTFVHAIRFTESEDQTPQQYLQTNFWSLKAEAFPASLQEVEDYDGNPVVMDCRSIMWCRINHISDVG